MPGERNGGMKKLALAIIAARVSLEACAAREMVFPSLPDGVLPFPEVSTNMALRVTADRVENYSIRLETSNGSTGEVLVAIGYDADGDGDLSFEETAFVFGRDCGTYYRVDYAPGSVALNDGNTATINKRKFKAEWNLMKIVKRGTGTMGETITQIVESKTFVIRVR